MPKRYLSKSQFTRGLQCHKALWLYKNRPELRAEPDAATQAKFDTGSEVGELAHQRFPGGVKIMFDREKIDEMMRQTREAIERGAETIYEATFRHDDVLVMVDILQKGIRGWELYEVKSSTGVKEYHKPDVAVQYYVLAGSGIDPVKASVVHLNNQYVRQGEIEVGQLFAVSDVTAEAQDLQEFVKAEIRKQRAMLENGQPDIDIGPQCEDPFRCDFYDSCWQHVPEDSVFELRERGADKFSLYRQGIIRQQDIPLDTLNPKQRFQVESTLAQRDSMNAEQVREFLAELRYPLCYLDFETFGTAVPLYDGSWPYGQIPFQYSLCVQEKQGGAVVHHDFLGEPGQDPREELLESLLAAIPQGACLVAFNAGFEKRCLSGLAELYPKHAGRINGLVESFVDLMQPFKNRDVYRWQAKGSYSLKAVLPAMVPELSYDGMEVADGETAGLVFLQMGAAQDPEERQRLRNALLAYCRQDTLGMVKIVEKLREMLS